MPSPDLAQGQAAHGNCQRLGTGVTRLAGYYWQEDSKGGQACNRVLEDTNYKGCKKRRKQVDMQPWHAFPDRESDRRKGTFVPARSDHGLDVGRRLGLDRRQEPLLTDDTNQMTLEVNHRETWQMLLLEQLDNLSSWRHGCHAGGYSRDQLAKPLIWICHGQVLDPDRSQVSALTVHHMKAADPHVPKASQSPQG
jgi:hypothetical protein